MKSTVREVRKVSIREIRNVLSKLMEHVCSGKTTLKDARTHLAAQLEMLERGEEILIMKDGAAIAKVVPLK